MKPKTENILRLERTPTGWVAVGLQELDGIRVEASDQMEALEAFAAAWREHEAHQAVAEEAGA